MIATATTPIVRIEYSSKTSIIMCPSGSLGCQGLSIVTDHPREFASALPRRQRFGSLPLVCRMGPFRDRRGREWESLDPAIRAPQAGVDRSESIDASRSAVTARDRPAGFRIVLQRVQNQMRRLHFCLSWRQPRFGLDRSECRTTSTHPPGVSWSCSCLPA
jgi:hypothetical protein